MSIKTVFIKGGKSFVGERNPWTASWIEIGSEQRFKVLSSKDFNVGEMVSVPIQNIDYIIDGAKDNK